MTVTNNNLGKNKQQVTPAILQSWLIIIVSLALTSFIYQETLSSLVSRWLKFDEGYGHGFLLLALVAWLFYELKNELLPVNGKLNFTALALLTPCLFVWFIGKASGIIIFQQAVLPMLWWASIWFIGGWKLAKSTIYPISFIYFCIPTWDLINSILVNLSIIVESFLLSISHFPVLIEGNRFNLPSGVISIADGCSGLRYLVIGLAFGTLAGRLYFTSIKMRAIVIIMSLVLSLVANWVRIYLLIIIGHFTEMESSLMQDHEMFGFWVFGFMLLPLFITIRKYSEPVQVIPAPKVQSKATKPLLFGLPLIALILYSAPYAIQQLSKDTPSQQTILSAKLSGESIQESPLPSAFFQEGNAIKHSQTWFYKNGQQALYIQVNTYQQTKLGDDFMPYNTFFNHNDWLVDKRKLSNIQPSFTNMQVTNRITGRKWLLLYWFDVAGYETSNKYKAKLAEIPALLSGRNDALTIGIYAQCPWQGCDGLLPKIDVLLNEELALIKQLSGNKK